MRIIAILVTLLVSALAIFLEFRSIKESTLFFNWISSVPLVVLWGILSVSLVMNARLLYRNERRLLSFLPLAICIVSLSLGYWHKMSREKLDNSATAFTATTYQIGSDGGFVLEFKKNGHLKGEKRDHWAFTNYWGSYSLNKDTVELDISLDIDLGRKAILTDTSLRFIRDSLSFRVDK